MRVCWMQSYVLSEYTYSTDLEAIRKVLRKVDLKPSSNVSHFCASTGITQAPPRAT